MKSKSDKKFTFINPSSSPKLITETFLQSIWKGSFWKVEYNSQSLYSWCCWTKAVSFVCLKSEWSEFLAASYYTSCYYISVKRLHSVQHCFMFRPYNSSSVKMSTMYDRISKKKNNWVQLVKDRYVFTSSLASIDVDRKREENVDGWEASREFLRGFFLLCSSFSLSPKDIPLIEPSSPS